MPNVPNSIEIWQKFRDEYSSSVIFAKTSVDDVLAKAATEVDAPRRPVLTGPLP